MKSEVRSGLLVVLCAATLYGCSSLKNSTGSTGTIWGSSSAPFPDENLGRRDAFIRLNEKIKTLNGGYGLEGHRSYDKGLPASWNESVMKEDVGICKVSFGSIKPNWTETANGTNYEAIKKFVQSIPDDRIVYLIFHHEPEDNTTQKGNSPLLLQQAFAKYVTAVLDAKKPNVHPCFNLMSYTFRPESGRNADDFNMAKFIEPAKLKYVIAALDGYAKTPDMSAESIFEAPFKKMESWGFTRFGIFETATHPDVKPGARAKWINDLGTWAGNRKNIELVSWFNSGVVPHAGPTGWFLGIWSKNGNVYSWDDSDGSVAAYAQVVRNK